MKKQPSEPDYKPTLLSLIVWIIICLGILTWIAIYFFGDKEPTMPESVKQEWIREKDREDATKEYFTEIQKHLDVNFVDKETVQIVWKNWEMNRKYYPQPFAHTYFYDEDHRIDTIKIRIGK